MPDITLTTDWSDKGYSLGLIKGFLVNRFPHSRIFDICHSVDRFDIKQAAFLLKTCYRAFPSGTIHIVCVLPHYSKENEMVFFEKNDHFFIGPNNGLFSLVFDDLHRAGSIPVKYKDEYPVVRSLCNAVARIVKPDPGELELEIELNQKLLIQPVVSGDTIRAVIIFIDHFGNLTLNIDRKLFKQVVGKKKFAIYFKNHEPIRSISTHYMDVPYGEVLCRFNASNQLEIAANSFSAAELLDLKIGDAVHLELL
nr:SAM-dependent chlorinase/fluorinase [Saprospiraceae bacterium]